VRGSRCSPLVVGPHASDDDVGEQSLVRAASFFAGLVLGAFADQVVLGGLVAARLVTCMVCSTRLT
jgi:hypothetical protein